MVDIIFTYDRSVINKTVQDIATAEKRFLDNAQRVVPVILRKAITPLTIEPREPTLPFVWSYDPGKQRQLRNAYFRKLPRGSRGGRYARSHKLVKAWKTDGQSTRDGAIFTVSNDVPYLDTVQGDEQYPSHADSGWVTYGDVMVKAADTAQDYLVDSWLGILG